MDRAKLRLTMHYSVAPPLRLGLEWNPLAEEFHPLVNWRILTETAARPAVQLSISTDRLGTPSGTGYTVVAAKNLTPHGDVRIAPYAGVTFGTYEHRFRPVAGLDIGFARDWSGLLIFDGVKVHPTLTWWRGRHSLSLIVAKGKHPGLSWSVVF